MDLRRKRDLLQNRRAAESCLEGPHMLEQQEQSACTESGSNFSITTIPNNGFFFSLFVLYTHACSVAQARKGFTW